MIKGVELQGRRRQVGLGAGGGQSEPKERKERSSH